MTDYFLQNLWLVWLTISFVTLIIELNSGDLYFLCLAGGALVSLVVAAIGFPLWLQVLLFAVTSVLCLLFVRPSLTKALHKGMKERKSNAAALIGRCGSVTETIPAGGRGYVKIDGDEWRSVAEEGMEIPAGTLVTVVAMESIVLTVKPK